MLNILPLRLSDEEDDKVDKLQPSIYYLQKLGPEYIDQVFSAARWMFEVDSDMTFEVWRSCLYLLFLELIINVM